MESEYQSRLYYVVNRSIVIQERAAPYWVRAQVTHDTTGAHRIKVSLKPFQRLAESRGRASGRRRSGEIPSMQRARRAWGPAIEAPILNNIREADTAFVPAEGMKSRLRDMQKAG